MKSFRTLNRIVLLSPAAVWLVFASGCSVEHEIVAKGTSEATITINQGLSFTLKGGETGITIPEGMPHIGGLHVGAGAELTVNIPAGTEIKLDDKVDIGGGSSESLQSQSAVLDPATRTATALPAQPKPVPTTNLQGTVLPGSTYTWYLPELFGDEAGAEVPVTGWVSAKAFQNALVGDGAGNYRLRDGGLIQFSYQVTGPPAVWQAPFDTPYGTVSGGGTIESSGGMVFEFSGPVSAVSGGGTTGYVDPDGVSWEYGYTGSFPVKLSSSGGEALGATTVEGGLDVY